MNIVLVTSSVTYVLDNYLSLLEKVCDYHFLPKGTKICLVVFVRIPSLYVLRNIVALLALGAPQTGITLLRNLTKSMLNDPRKKLLYDRGISWISVDNINHASTIDALKSTAPDLIVNLRTRNIYKKPVLELPKIGCINIHHGLLPENRGTMCDLWAWVQKRPVGFTIHWMNEKIDDGHILARQEIDVKNIKRYIDIPYASSLIERDVLIDCIRKLQENPKFYLLPNICSEPTYTRNPTATQIKEIRKKGLML